jgi:hypothetical protein
MLYTRVERLPSVAGCALESRQRRITRPPRILPSCIRHAQAPRPTRPMKLANFVSLGLALAAVDAAMLRPRQLGSQVVVWDGRIENTAVLPALWDLPLSAEERMRFQEHVDSLPQPRCVRRVLPQTFKAEERPAGSSSWRMAAC